MESDIPRMSYFFDRKKDEDFSSAGTEDML